jgi:flagellin
MIGVATAGAASAVATSGVSNLSVSTFEASQTAIALVDDALSTVNTTRSTLGATQSRFESAVASQMTTAENLSASRSRIMDADFAAETANLAKAQILQQSGIAMLAQANAIPQNVLALLQ